MGGFFYGFRAGQFCGWQHYQKVYRMSCLGYYSMG